jgi:hypothetical protein
MTTPVTAKHGINFTEQLEGFESDRIPTINLEEFKYKPSVRQHSANIS